MSCSKVRSRSARPSRMRRVRRACRRARPGGRARAWSRRLGRRAPAGGDGEVAGAGIDLAAVGLPGKADWTQLVADGAGGDACRRETRRRGEWRHSRPRSAEARRASAVAGSGTRGQSWRTPPHSRCGMRGAWSTARAWQQQVDLASVDTWPQIVKQPRAVEVGHAVDSAAGPRRRAVANASDASRHGGNATPHSGACRWSVRQHSGHGRPEGLLARSLRLRTAATGVCCRPTLPALRSRLGGFQQSRVRAPSSTPATSNGR